MLFAIFCVVLCLQVCDGHGGADAAEFVRSTLFHSVLMDENLCMDLKEALVSCIRRRKSPRSSRKPNPQRNTSNPTAYQANLAFFTSGCVTCRDRVSCTWTENSRGKSRRAG